MSDRLLAVPTLAQKFQLKLDERYLAGLWENDLICGLSWASDTMKCDEYHRDMSDRAPSWSWASVEGPVKFGFINETMADPENPIIASGSESATQILGASTSLVKLKLVHSTPWSLV